MFLKCTKCLLPILLMVSIAACDKGGGEVQTSAPASAQPSPTGMKEEVSPPAPPVVETFDREPQLNLFARVGAYRPKDDDKEGLGYWATFIDHLQRTSGMRPGSGKDGTNGWVMHGIKGLESIAYFAPLAVKPGKNYRVTFDLKGDLPKGGNAGIGVIEFDQFFWISDQFTEQMCKEHQTAAYQGVGIKGKVEQWKAESFTFTTSSRGAMVHLVIYRDGEMDRSKPVVFDNISVREEG